MSKKVKLSEIANIKMGQSPSGDTCNDIGNGIALLNGPAEFTSYYPVPKQYTIDGKRFSDKGEILFCVRGSTTGRMNWGDQKYALGRGLASISHKNGNEYNHFLKFLLQSNLKSLLNAANGSTFPNLTSDILASFELNVPEEKTQKTISFFLQSIDSKIELNNRINSELEAMAKTLYDYWFVQFDFPHKNGKPYKTSGGTLVWSEKLKREIPEGWEVKKIGKILKTSLGGTPSTKVKEYWENGKISWLNSGEIANFPIIDSELKITEAAIKNSATDLLPKGSVMLSITRHLRPSILGISACANQSVIGILEKDDIKCYFLYPYLQNEIPRLMEMRSGAQQPHINKEIVDESFILLPNNETELLKKYNAHAGHFYESIINNAFQNQKLTELRDWLLPMLMNGQVKVN